MEQGKPRLRWLLIWAVAVVWMAAVLGRLAYLQLYCYSDYFAKAQRQQQRTFEISPTRGTIYDRAGRILAVSIPMDSVFGDPSDISDAAMVARLLSPVLDTPAPDLQQKITSASKPVRLAKKLTPEQVDRITDMNLKGVFFLKENRRVYPQHELAAALVGYVDTDEKGSGGIEQRLDKWIRGKPGRGMEMSDGKQRRYDPHDAAGEPGASVTLTIDETLQFIAEKELDAAMKESHAIGGTIVVQDPNSGALLAVANYPPFDANDPGRFPAETREDRAVSAAYEPGSTFKMITMAGAIERGLTNPNEMIDCQNGSIMVMGRLIHDHLPFGVLSVTEVLEKSSDVGTIKIAERMGNQRFYQTIRDFSIGQSTGIELPGENRGMLHSLPAWTPSSIGSVAIGQEVSVTPIQMISATSAIANGGTLYTPKIVQDLQGGSAGPLPTRAEPHQATDARTAATLREMMESVIIKGTGKPAKLDGYTAAGKSGTAQKIDTDTGRYSATKYIASFVGFAPVNTPAVTILVMLDSPQGEHMGGNLGGPVFKRVAEQTLAYLEIAHDVQGGSDEEFAKSVTKSGTRSGPNGAAGAPQALDANESKDEARYLAVAGKSSDTDGDSTPSPDTVAINEDGITIPNFSGQPVRAVLEECSRLGIMPNLIGSGLAMEQSPAPSMVVPRGTAVTVRFGHAPAKLVPASSRAGH